MEVQCSLTNYCILNKLLRELLIAQLKSCFRVTVLNAMTHASEVINLSVILPVMYRYGQAYHIKISREKSTSCQNLVH